MVSILAICLMLFPALSIVSANAPPDPKFVIIADTKTIGEDGEIELEPDDWILLDATESRDADGKIMYYRWTIKDEDGEPYVDKDGRQYRNVNTGENSLKVRIHKEGIFTIILSVGDDGTEGQQKTEEFSQTIVVEEKTRTVEVIYAIVVLIVALVFGAAVGKRHFIRGVLLTGKEKEKGGKKGKRGRGRRRAAKSTPRRKVAVARPTAAATAAPRAESFGPPEEQIRLQPYKEKLQKWEQMNVDVSPLRQVVSDAEAGKIKAGVVDAQFANFEGLVTEMNNLKMSVNEWKDLEGFDNEIREIMIFNNPLRNNELKAKMNTLRNNIAAAKREKEATPNYDMKHCAKCHTEMKVPKTRPVEVKCEQCGQRHVYKKKKK